eukprot:UN04127
MLQSKARTRPAIDIYLDKLNENEDILSELLDEIYDEDTSNEDSSNEGVKLPENEAIIDEILDEIEEKSDTFELWVKKQWKMGSKVEVLSSSSSDSWFEAKVVGIFNDSSGEWLEVQYVADEKLRLKRIRRSDTAAIRPLSKAMGIYQYIYNSILNNTNIKTEETEALPIQIIPQIMHNYREKEKNMAVKSYLIIDCRKDEEIANEAVLSDTYNDWIHIPMQDILDNAKSKSYMTC